MSYLQGVVRQSNRDVDLQAVDGQNDAFPPAMLFIDLVHASIRIFLSSHISFRPQQNGPAKIKNKKKRTNKVTKETSRASEPIIPPVKEYQYIRFSKRWFPRISTKKVKLFIFFVSYLLCVFRFATHLQKNDFDEANDNEVRLSGCVSITSSSKKKVDSPNSNSPRRGTVVDSGSFHPPVRKTLLSGCFMTRASR